MHQKVYVLASHEIDMLIDSMVDMILGMGLGMVVSPIMMKVIKNLIQKRRINRILHEISELQRAPQ